MAELNALINVLPGMKKVNKVSKKDKKALAEAEKKEASKGSSSPPPGYNDNPPDYDAEDALTPPDITAGFSKLNLTQSNDDGKPTVAQCIAHLKVLECFYRLRQKTGSTDGLFGIYDNAVLDSGVERNDKTPELLAKLAEKRWAIYVARAVDRFEAWSIAAAPSTGMMTISELEREGPKGNLCEPESAPMRLKLDTTNMPPADVLMVWHAYMLNPRAYLEDCLRQGRMQLWHTRFPWQAAADCINSETFAYEANVAADEMFTSRTGRPWDNNGEKGGRTIKCPKCKTTQAAEWTTCSDNSPAGGIMKSQDVLATAIDGMLESGTGFCDQHFSHDCTSCGHVITHERLAAGKFCQDTQQLLDKEIPMGGTILGSDGIPFSVGHHLDIDTKLVLQTANRLLSHGVGEKIIAGVRVREGKLTTDSMEGVRDVMEVALKDKNYLLKVRGLANIRLSRTERIAVRKMMRRYWDNGSPFALDLVGAVIRQGGFVEKMHNIDWLHSPALPSTMGRLITKYGRFMLLMKDRYNMCVPTLDVDLAWHTHQLDPYPYLRYTLRETKRFIDHDDKVAETVLNDAFAWTSKTYQKNFGEPYSNCTCCTTSRIFRKSASTPRDQLHDAEQDPRKSVHISAHNAVRPHGDTATYERDATRHADELEKMYQKACERARKKGRKEPKRNDYYYSDAWGYPVYIPAYSPYIGFMPYSVGYYPMSPGCMAVGAGAAGACAAGTCGGAGGAGACGVGASGGCGGGGACAGGAGGCGGGGGGGCGGGGGGGGCGGGGGGG